MLCRNAWGVGNQPFSRKPAFKVRFAFAGVIIVMMYFALPGCGEAERPRFVPASANSATAIPAAERPSKVSGSVSIPRNIKTH